jgi:DNA-binding transcriptional MerR regulator
MAFKIPDKLTFKRSEIIKITKLDGKVLDYWEKEFECFTPVVNKLGEKFYTKRDIELILRIKQLMLVEKVPKSEIKKIVGTDELSTGAISDKATPSKKKIDPDKLNKIKSNLKDILTILNKNGK